jgi:hypothetical protein
MANRKLSIGCVLVMGGALTNCGGTVETRGEGPDERGQGGSGFVGVPIMGGFQGTIPGVPGIGFGGYVGNCCYAPGAGAGGYVGVPPIGQGGVGTIAGGEGPYGGEGGYIGVGGDGGVGVRAEAEAAGWGGEGGIGGDDGF